jgi:hypothetical protein
MIDVLIVIGIVVGVIWALVVFPSFRIVAGFLVLAGGGLTLWANQQASEQQKRDEAEKQVKQAQLRADCDAYREAEATRWNIVQPVQIEVRDPSFTEKSVYPLGGSPLPWRTQQQRSAAQSGDYSLTASLKNKSAFPVTHVELKITARDCLTNGACETIGHADATLYADVPGGGVRKAQKDLHFNDLPAPRGTLSWSIIVSRVRSEPAESDDSEQTVDDLLADWTYCR